jgi:steroid delta-isomerase-like uncharacterized protein
MTDIKELAQGLMDGSAAGADLDATIDRYIAEDFVEHEQVAGMEHLTGRDLPRQMFGGMHAAFPDFRIDVHELLAEGDKVVCRITMSGTHQGEFMGMPPSGNRFAMDAIEIMQAKDDKFVAHWGVMDRAGMIEQLSAGAVG